MSAAFCIDVRAFTKWKESKSESVLKINVKCARGWKKEMSVILFLTRKTCLRMFFLDWIAAACRKCALVAIRVYLLIFYIPPTQTYDYLAFAYYRIWLIFLTVFFQVHFLTVKNKLLSGTNLWISNVFLSSSPVCLGPTDWKCPLLVGSQLWAKSIQLNWKPESRKCLFPFSLS